MRIAYVTDFDPTDPRYESGLAPAMTCALESQGIEVTRVHVRATPWLRTASVIRKLAYARKGKTYLGKRSRARIASYRRQVTHVLERRRTDAILGPNPSPLAALTCTQPIVLWTDTMAGGLIGFYPETLSFTEETIRDSRRADQACLDHCALAIFSSRWAAAVATRDYAVDPAKVKVVPFGASVEEPLGAKEVRELIRSRGTRRCELLFLGGDWRRKGGPFAMEVTSELRRLGIEAQLTTIGPPTSVVSNVPAHIRMLGFVSRRTPGGRRVLWDALAKTDFLILPTVADCTPNAVAEAMSLGVPCMTTDVGGLPSLISDDINGRMFHLGVSAMSWAEHIADVFGNRAIYDQLAMNAYDQYRTRLNWPLCAAQVKELLEDL